MSPSTLDEEHHLQHIIMNATSIQLSRAAAAHGGEPEAESQQLSQHHWDAPQHCTPHVHQLHPKSHRCHGADGQTQILVCLSISPLPVF